jgi:hypothetical protein
MKQSLQLKLGQQLTMTPQLQQAIRLLQLSTLDLQQEIQEALDSNPMLEIEEPGDLSSADGEDRDYPRELEIPAATGDSSSTETARDGDMDGYGEAETAGDWNEAIPSELPVDTSWDDVYQSTQSSAPTYDGEDGDYDSRRGTTDSLYDHLMWQLNLTPMSDADRIIAMAIIDARPRRLSSQSPNLAFSLSFAATLMPALKVSAGDAFPPSAPSWNSESTIDHAKSGPTWSTNRKKPMNMMRRTSSANQVSSEGAWIASQTAAMAISMPARIQNSDVAALMRVCSQLPVAETI